MDNRFIGLVIGLVIGVLMIGSLLVPTINDATTTEKTFTNEGAFYVEMDPADSYSIKYDKTADPNTVLINGESTDIPFSSGYTILILDDAILRLQTGQNTQLQYKGNGQYIVGIDSLDLTVGNGTVSGTYTNTNHTTDTSFPTTTYEKAYVVSPDEQQFIMTAYNTSSLIKKDSDIFAFGQTIIGTNTLVLIRITGNIEDGVVVEILDSTSGQAVVGATVSNLSINATEKEGYIDLYSISSITFDVAYSDTTTAVTYSAYIIPTNVTAELADHLDAGEIAMIAVIPVLMIASLLIFAVRFVTRD